MSKPNSKRNRRTVELGPKVDAMVEKLRGEGKLRERFNLYAHKLNDSAVIRLAVLALFRECFPADPLARTDGAQLGGNVAVLL